MKYASQTSVSVEKSRAEIEGTLSRYGATKFAYMTEDLRAVLAFEISRTMPSSLSRSTTTPPNVEVQKISTKSGSNRVASDGGL